MEQTLGGRRVTDHDCIQTEAIAQLQERSAGQVISLEKIDGKLDKIMWFIIGLATSACGAMIAVLFQR